MELIRIRSHTEHSREHDLRDEHQLSFPVSMLSAVSRFLSNLRISSWNRLKLCSTLVSGPRTVFVISSRSRRHWLKFERASCSVGPTGNDDASYHVAPISFVVAAVSFVLNFSGFHLFLQSSLPVMSRFGLAQEVCQSRPVHMRRTYYTCPKRVGHLQRRNSRRDRSLPQKSRTGPSGGIFSPACRLGTVTKPVKQTH